MPRNRFSPAAVFLIVVGLPLVYGSPQPAAAKADAPAFGDFSQRVDKYIKMRKSLPHEKTTKHQEDIVDRRHKLAEAIRASRADAKQGDIFAPEISEQFVKVIRGTLHGSPAARKTIRQGEPVAGVHLTVNAAYPEHLPVTTVPPTLLLRLPRLPDRLAYRLVGHDLILQDTEARLVIDFIPGALP
jgi:hypothetical protein